jgi:hypothetical protein
LETAKSSGQKASGFASGRMVALSLAAAALWPVAGAHAQLAVNCTQVMNFDDLAACGGGGSVKVTPGGAVSDGGCVLVLGTPKQAKCSVQNFATSGSIQVKMSAKTINLTGAGTMQLKSFNIATPAGGPTKTWTDVALTATPLEFGVGGLLSVNPGQSNGVYSGNVIMTVTFTP